MPEQEAQGTLHDLYQGSLSSLGYIANYVRAFSLRPEVMRAWQGLNGAIVANMDRRHYELATLAAATALRSSYCSLAHGKVLRQFYGDAEITELAKGGAHPLEPAEAALMAFARKVVLHADQVTQEDIALAAAARCFFGKTLDALGAEPDRAYGDLGPELREALTVGRSISQR